MINREIELDLSWLTNYIISEISRTVAAAATATQAARQATETTGATFPVKSAKLYIPGAILPIINNIKFTDQLKQRFKRTVSLNKLRSEIRIPPKNSNLDYMIDPPFRNINRLLVLFLPFKNCFIDLKRHFYHEYYIPLVEIKDFNVLVKNKLINLQKTKAYEKFVEMSKTDIKQ